MPSDPFVDPAALSSLGPVRYLDARDQAAFDAGHAPGAVRVPLDAWDAAIKSADTGFEKTAFWDDAIGSLGVGPSVTAVAYDGGAMTNAARVWFVLQYYGVNCVILNGGWPGTGRGDRVAGECRAIDRRFPGICRCRVRWVWSIGRPCKRQLDGAAQVFDSRTRAEFTGEDMRKRVAQRAPAGCAASVACGPDGRRGLCIRHRCCARCWRGWGSARAITS